MSGYVMAIAPCYSCKRPFSFNPHQVPSIRIEGERQPICADCMHAANAQRVAMGMQPHPIHPKAYAVLPEGEL